jgi:hypothetical protein
MNFFSNVFLLRCAFLLLLAITISSQSPSIRCTNAGSKVFDDILGFDWGQNCERHGLIPKGLFEFYPQPEPVPVLSLKTGSSNNHLPGTNYKFMVAGHTRRSEEHKGSAFNPDFSKFLKNYPLGKLAYVVLTGDFLYAGLPGEWIKMKKEIWDYPVKFHFVPGNHDMVTKFEFEKRSGMDQLYGSFFHGEDLFVILSDPTWMSLKAKRNQMELLKNEMGKEHRHTFIFAHYIYWGERWGLAVNSFPKDAFFWGDILPLLKSHKKPVFMFGGDASGMFDVVNIENVRLIGNGLSSHYLESNAVALVEVGGSGVRVIPTSIAASENVKAK